MTCYHPNKAFRLNSVNPKTGKNWICFKERPNIKEIIHVPCGQCSGCRLERARIWAIRCMHELQTHTSAQYVTLTYNDKHIPPDGTLSPRDLTLFYKELRKAISPLKIRHFSCGEYGESCDICGHNQQDCQSLNHHKYHRTIGRPHYHAIIFGLNLTDLEYHTKKNDNNLYTSKFLEKIWKRGNVIIGEVTFESCSYVARYIMKKITGDKAHEHYYIGTDHATGQDISYYPEFIRMSLRPGIASDWYDKYKSDIWNNEEGTVTIRGGIKTTPPRYYEEKFSISNPITHKKIKERRAQKAEENKSDNTYERLEIKQRIFDRKIKSLTRTLE